MDKYTQVFNIQTEDISIMQNLNIFINGAKVEGVKEMGIDHISADPDDDLRKITIVFYGTVETTHEKESTGIHTNR